MKNILSNTAKRLLGHVEKKYDPFSYWNSRRDPNSAEGLEAERVRFDTDYIRKQVSSGMSVLELGPGVGRTFHAYEKGTLIETIDISRLYEKKLTEAAKAVDLKLKQHFLSDDWLKFPFSDQQFDVAVCFQVFIHQPPEVFHRSFTEFSRVCKKGVISVGLHANTKQSNPAEGAHVFRHDYLHEASNNHKVINNLILRNNVLYFTIENID
ncbi:class I SAM-dependent methyltransferase [Pseudomaricurvus alcaniphilus]|uniref:class I SAM-dependent methyltransferase n=1 Tax=Pseudomaricurvus alcaniphilus TaxID=1166482 RepID=UPI00140AC8F6|nr:class I SAM-dependent methyltransferase [Pseudomaricurvus alcaniphilus]NHN36724.1 class I SAM-dependent methyltransferase [Pseudomaricurvus alcaniphilus]